ncbi:dienelactone hydrolase family protein [Paracraurococcus lichenis]|uniref:Dienelactone hydrolase n=1 Tax=Paracraurococcus lichenis TaxID=3064888 RepID=A0ABT9DS70_9PROT|nr:hypothetical protein [Paracraurococcus sp. LOR1-02]MDO9706737.1 hypothetical protein [Paracraurococcus sp. LOR1-02]
MPSQTRSRRRPRRALLALALLLPALAARAEAVPDPEAAATEIVRIGAAEVALLTLPAPSRPGPRRPVVLLLPDADGAGTRAAVYGQRLLDNGLAVLEPQFGGNEPDGTAPMTPLATRLPLALGAVAADPRLDPARVAVVGLGEGARAALLGLGGEAAPAALALLYPGCDTALTAAARRVTGAPKVLILHGDEDPANDAAACAALAGAFPAQQAVRQRVLTGASYGWDAFGLVRPGGVTLLAHPADPARRAWSQPDERTTIVAADRVLGFVLAALGGP